MNLFLLINYALKEITRCKGRSFTTITGYFLSAIIFGIIISLLSYTGKSIENTLNNTGTHFIAFKPQCCGLPYMNDPGIEQKFIANGILSQPLPITLVNEIKKIPEVKDATPYLLYRLHDPKYKDILIGGFDPENSIAVANTCCSADDITAGRFLNKDDHESVIIEESFSRAYNLHAGHNLKLGDISFIIAGIVNPGIRPAKADVYMIFNTAEIVIGNDLKTPVKDLMNIVLIESLNANKHMTAMQKVSKIMGQDSLISSYGCFKPASGAININNMSLKIFFILIFLFVLVFSFKNQYDSIFERKHDFGILSSIGWYHKRIVGMIMLESIIQTLIGGIAGSFIFFLFIVSPLQTIIGSSIKFDLIISAVIFFSGFLIVSLAGILASFISSLIILKKLPAKNLRVLY